jgi:hypothetical protein
MQDNVDILICDFVDHLMPELTPYESSLYLLFLRTSVVQNNSWQTRIGKRTIAERLGKGSMRGIQGRKKRLHELKTNVGGQNG